MLEAQRQALAPLARMDGVWRGPAWTITPNGRHDIIQTERIGPFLGGSVRVIEGRGYNADGSVGFNALGIISFNPATSAYTMTSWAQGYGGVFPFRPTADGYTWEVPAGPGAIIRYTATIGDGTLREVGHLIAGNAPPRPDLRDEPAPRRRHRPGPPATRCRCADWGQSLFRRPVTILRRRAEK